MAAFEASVRTMVMDMMDGKGPGVHDVVNRLHRDLDLNAAVQQLDGKLPEDVASLVHMTTSQTAQAQGTFDEASMQKARRILNDMLLKAWAELDDVIFECMEFRDRNRGTYKQVVSDLARLGSTLARLEQERIEASEGEQEQERQRLNIEDLVSKTEQEYTAIWYENYRQLTIKKNDLAVFDYILQATACKEDGAFLQLQGPRPQVQICRSQRGMELNFTDRALQAKVEKMMSPEARLALRAALGQVGASFLELQRTGRRAAETTSPTTTTNVPEYDVEVVPVMQEPHPDGQWRKCVDGPVNCGYLHDLMSLEWGKFRDSFDELTAEMNGNKMRYEETKRNLNDQLTVINDEKRKYMELWAGTVASINADTEEMNDKDEQKRDLTEEFDKQCAIFRHRITEILHTKICAVRKVRNAMLITSTQTPPSQISDCDFTDWASKTGQCFSPSGQAIRCDDTCPKPNPYDCGGLETMKRDVVVSPNAAGMQCPQLERKKKCAQKKCEVDCLMSVWSGWSACTKECGSGLREKTRSILVKPHNGGKVCSSIQEEENCNTGDCRRDCKLADWSAWEPCSMACGGGRTRRTKKVLVPIRGEGKCPTPDSGLRLEYEVCNPQDCGPGLICIAKQDVIIALDASGSLKEHGFEILRRFAANFTQRYRATYFGAEAIRMGLVLFGNGRLSTQPDGTTTISAAVPVQPLTDDIGLVAKKVLEQTWQRGFTNMAQALAAADIMLTQGGRPEAQSAIVVLSDGKYSFKYQTAEKAQEIKDKNIMLYMAPVMDFEDRDLDALKEWASQPWETNYERIPGLASLEHSSDVFVQKLIVKFCPDSMSPDMLLRHDEVNSFMLIHEDGYPSRECGAIKDTGTVQGVDACEDAARKENFKVFSIGKEASRNRCWIQDVAVTKEYYEKYLPNRTKPAVPCKNGRWQPATYDTYAINPSSFEVYPGAGD